MGTGGSGNFDSDTSADFVGHLTNDLIAKVEKYVAKPALLEPDSYGGEIVPCIVDLLLTLHAATGTASIPKPEVVAAWRAKYMDVWEATIDGLEPSPQHKLARRTVLKRTFDRLERLARRIHKYAGASGAHDRGRITGAQK